MLATTFEQSWLAIVCRTWRMAHGNCGEILWQLYLLTQLSPQLSFLHAGSISTSGSHHSCEVYQTPSSPLLPVTIFRNNFFIFSVFCTRIKQTCCSIFVICVEDSNFGDGCIQRSTPTQGLCHPGVALHNKWRNWGCCDFIEVKRLHNSKPLDEGLGDFLYGSRRKQC